ncbi:MAG: MoaD/ThiS family protein [Candidatus Lindowbacteria bacterium]|nr:MoaD/ThiS family protein [Candidatus Lindowbacteria bacterium]
MKVYVKLYATLTKYVGQSIMHEPMQVELAEGATLATLYERLSIPEDEVKTAFVNSKMESVEYVLCDGDHVGIFPPVGGGHA